MLKVSLTLRSISFLTQQHIPSFYWNLRWFLRKIIQLPIVTWLNLVDISNVGAIGTKDQMRNWCLTKRLNVKCLPEHWELFWFNSINAKPRKRKYQEKQKSEVKVVRVKWYNIFLFGCFRRPVCLWIPSPSYTACETLTRSLYFPEPQFLFCKPRIKKTLTELLRRSKCFHIGKLYPSGSQIKAVLFLRRHLAKSGNIFNCFNWEKVDFWHLTGRSQGCC